MADKSVVLDVGDEINNAQDELVFQDFQHLDSTSSKSEQTITFTNFPHTADDDEHDDKAELLEAKKQPSMLTFEFYQSFFDVDVKQVLSRMLLSVYPHPHKHYLDTHIKNKPDFYGPFWICTTLILSITISGNLANYFTAHQQNVHFHWQYNFHKVTTAMLAIFMYWLLMPCVLHLVLRWRSLQTDCTFAELVCLYGYSLCVYIPVSILWLIPVMWLRWLLVLCALMLSGLVLAFNLWPIFKHDHKKTGWFMTAAVFLMHALLAVSFMLYFFSAVPPISASAITSPASSITPVIPSKSIILGKIVNALKNNSTINSH